MNTTYLDFPVRNHLVDQEDTAPFLAEEVREAESQLLTMLESASAGTIIRVDLKDLHIASDAVRGLLRRPLQRIRGGEKAEIVERYIVLTNVKHNWHSLDVTLKDEDLVSVAYRSPTDIPKLLGKLDTAVTETYNFICAEKETTAKTVMRHFELKTIAAASNRLTTLLKYALVRRADERSTGTGGREYLYEAIL